MNIMSTQTLTLARPQRQTLVASNGRRSSGANVVTLPVAPGVIFTQLPLEAFVPIPGLEPRIEELIQAGLAYERKQRANAVNRRMSRKMGGASAPGAPNHDSDYLQQTASALLLRSANDFSNAATNAGVDAVIAYLAKVLAERFTPLAVPPPPAGPAPPHVPASDKAGSTLYAAYSVAFMANYSAIEQNKVIAAGRTHLEAMIAALRELKAAVRANANGPAGQDQNRRIKHAATIALVSVNEERENANIGEVVSNMARHLAAFLPDKAAALRAAATLLAPTSGGGAAGAPAVATAAPVGSLSGALLASAAAGSGVAAFAPAPVVGAGGAVDPRVPVTFSKDAVPTTALGAVAEYLPTAIWGLGLPTASMAGSFLLSQVVCYGPETLCSALGAPSALNYAKAAAVGLTLATGRSALGKVYENDRLYVRSAAEYVGGVWSDCQRNRAAASAAASARQIVDAHLALIKAAREIEINFPVIVGEARLEGVAAQNLANVAAANTTERGIYQQQHNIAQRLPEDRREAATDKALKRLVDFRTREAVKLRARIAALAKEKKDIEARTIVELERQLAAAAAAPMASTAAAQRPAPAAAAPLPPPQRTSFTPGALVVPPPVRGVPRARTPGRAPPPQLPVFGATAVAPTTTATAAAAPGAANAAAPNAAGGGPALAQAVVQVPLDSLINKPEYEYLACMLPAEQREALLTEINSHSWKGAAAKAATLEAVREFIRTQGAVTVAHVGTATRRNASDVTAIKRQLGIGGRRTRRKRRTMRNRR